MAQTTFGKLSTSPLQTRNCCIPTLYSSSYQNYITTRFYSETTLVVVIGINVILVRVHIAHVSSEHCEQINTFKTLYSPSWSYSQAAAAWCDQPGFINNPLNHEVQVKYEHVMIGCLGTSKMLNCIYSSQNGQNLTCTIDSEILWYSVTRVVKLMFASGKFPLSR